MYEPHDYDASQQRLLPPWLHGNGQQADLVSDDLAQRRPSRTMMRRGAALAALARRGFAAAGARDGDGVAREAVAAVSELRLPPVLQKRAEAERRQRAADAAADPPLDLPVQLSPYQALPVDGRITRHFTRGLPVLDPAGRTQQARLLF